MTNERWIVVRNWTRFQHYKGRRPSWIKTYVELLDDVEYLRLTGIQRATLHGLWLWYAQLNGGRDGEDIEPTWIPLRLEMINRKLGLSVKMATIEALNHAGFIDILASNPLAKR